MPGPFNKSGMDAGSKHNSTKNQRHQCLACNEAESIELL